MIVIINKDINNDLTLKVIYTPLMYHCWADPCDSDRKNIL